MRISELSQRSGIPLPTIKFYLREGLIPAGRKTGRNQAEYGANHLERLALIRALTQDAGLAIEQVAKALSAADRARGDFVIAAIDALQNPGDAAVDTNTPEFRRAKKTVLALAHLRGWNAKPTDASVGNAARALARALQGMPQADVTSTSGTPCAPVNATVEPASLEFYAEALERIVEHEIPEDWQPETDREAALRYAMLGTVLYEPFLLALRRMAHVARTRELAAGARERKEGRAHKRHGR